jgi:hypothetical protein
VDKNDKDIRKEIEELEKLIEKVKKQNEEEKKKHTQPPKNTVVRINLASVYSNNFWVNMLFSALINFIVIFSVLKLFSFATISNDINIIWLVAIFTVIEETYKRYLLTKQVKLVIYTSGLIFTFINLVLFYVLDLFVFGNDFSFVNSVYPIAFVVVFQGARAIIKNVYIRIIHKISLRRIKNK